MPPQSASTSAETLPSWSRVHVLGAGPGVYMQSKMIKHNKDLFECVDDPFALLDKLHIY